MEEFAYEAAHLGKLRPRLAECVVLLKTNGDFPLGEAGKIAAYGRGVRNTIRGGTGSGEVNVRHFVTVEEGLTQAGFEITTGAWLDAYEATYAQARAQFVLEIKARAKKNHTLAVIEGMGAVMAEPEYDLPLEGEGDTAIYVLTRLSGEQSDRIPGKGDVYLTDTEVRDILTLNRQYSKFMLVLNVGGVVDLTPVLEVENILCLSQLGTETGHVLSDILLGRATPSGKLTTTWAAYEDYPHMGDFGAINDTHYTEGVYVGYRYFDTVGKTPLFPFGYGCSYTTFDIQTQNLSKDGSTLTIEVAVTNTGAYVGKEVVQVYASCPKGRIDKPYQSLIAFGKTEDLAPGKSQVLTLSFDLTDLASYDEENSTYLMEAGDYLLRVGNSSAHTTPVGVVHLDQPICVTQVKRCGGGPVTDWVPDHLPAVTIPKGIPVLEVSPCEIQTRVVSYELEEPTLPQATALTNRQLAYLSVGAFHPLNSLANVIGESSKTVAGVAGESTRMLVSQGFPTLVMADGPAGLRVAPAFVRTSNGVKTMGEGGSLPKSILEFMPKALKGLMNLVSGGNRKPKRGQVVEYHWATALPIGTALAQSWNPNFAALCGDIVGDEMTRFGIHLWLAPAMNIHRNILCGRNFEYFSEDPHLTGKMAAALTLGVQSHPGCGVTIKHFAANNQETNRTRNNSVVSERALREIYLRGFGICVKEAHPVALMTAYNLLNGTHTASHRGLIHDILRCEWGFEGIVVTDWIVAMMAPHKASIHPAPCPKCIARAGGDIIMPGSKAAYKAILRALRRGTLSRKQLEQNATHYLRTKETLGL